MTPSGFVYQHGGQDCEPGMFVPYILDTAAEMHQLVGIVWGGAGMEDDSEPFKRFLNTPNIADLDSRR
jgi:hypothetical protein